MNKKRYLIIVGIVAAAVLLAVLLDTMLANHRPAITSLETEVGGIFPLESCQITCHATDPDEDELSYNWSAGGGGITGEGTRVTWTAPNSAGSYSVTVIVIDGRGGEVTDYITIMVWASSTPAITFPTITSLVANADWTVPLGGLQVTCNATYPDGDELSYEWSTTGGDISGTGAVVSWNAPEEVGIYYITVVVTDSQGEYATRSIALIASNGPPPIIENLIVTAKEPRYLTEGSQSGCDYNIWKAKEYDIQCQVADTSGKVSYTWSCDGGEISEISEDGSMITWTAPNEAYVQAIVTVVVSDDAGNKAGKNIHFYVPSSVCVFG